jgi:hypothetical protein
MLEDATAMLSRHTGHQSPRDAMQRPTRRQQTPLFRALLQTAQMVDNADMNSFTMPSVCCAAQCRPIVSHNCAQFTPHR